MNKELLGLIEDQINKELWSAYIYYDMAEYYEGQGLHGLHAWFAAQAKEEVEHANKFCKFLQDLGESFSMKAIPAPGKTYKDLREPLAYQVEHEALVTGLILNIYRKAKDVGDISTSHFMSWYVNEQLEEESTAKDMLGQYDLYAAQGGLGLHLFDKEIASSRD
ncbi:MAG: ferritin [Bacilli bacterium]|nr:ferritin [Bacilli bacterium]